MTAIPSNERPAVAIADIGMGEFAGQMKDRAKSCIARISEAGTMVSIAQKVFRLPCRAYGV